MNKELEEMVELMQINADEYESQIETLKANLKFVHLS